MFSKKSSQQHEFGILNELLELLAPVGSNGTIDDAMIRAKRDIHQSGDLELIVSARGILINDDALLRTADGQDTCLRWVNDSREVVHTEHAEVGHSECTTG